MGEKPILFSTPLIQAILDGRKTQTRRVVKPQPPKHLEWGGWQIGGGKDSGKATWDNRGDGWLSTETHKVATPYGNAGDELWVRETWQAQTPSGKWWHEIPKGERPLHNWAVIDKATSDIKPPKWIPSVHIPRKFSRIQLCVKNVRVERVQDISGDDVHKEGVTSHVHPTASYFERAQREVFEALWDSINEKRGYSWQSNPWVWVVDFEVMR